MLGPGPFASRIAGPEYAATGCSHGAGTVHAWSMKETVDYPARSFARSTGSGGLCQLYNDYACPQVRAYIEQEFTDRFGTADPEDFRVRAFHDDSDTLANITDEVVRTREVARSWGAATGEPICNADGTPACNEEGLWAMHFTSRRFRDVWERTQPPEAPSGYFVEDHSSSCRHCAPATSLAFQCGVCMLKVGRLGMESACPTCLSYGDPTIARGGAAESCDIPASWYSDPLQSPDTGEPVVDSPSGCGCGAAGLEAGWLVVLLAWVVIRSVRGVATARSFTYKDGKLAMLRIGRPGDY